MEIAMKPEKNKKEPVVVARQQVTFLLVGNDVQRFRAFKRNANLQRDAEVARKLVLDRLDEIEKAA